MAGKLTQAQHEHRDLVEVLSQIANALESRSFGDAPTYLFTIERNSSGFIVQIRAEPVDD